MLNLAAQIEVLKSLQQANLPKLMVQPPQPHLSINRQYVEISAHKLDCLPFEAQDCARRAIEEAILFEEINSW